MSPNGPYRWPCTWPLAIFAGVSLDLFSDGVMIGTATVLNPSLGLLLALGQVPADVPEGFAAIATVRRAGIPRRTRILMALGFAVPILIGATVGYFALRQAPEILTLSVTSAVMWRGFSVARWRPPLPGKCAGRGAAFRKPMVD